jgi:hypothetical protein
VFGLVVEVEEEEDGRRRGAEEVVGRGRGEGVVGEGAGIAEGAQAGEGADVVVEALVETACGLALLRTDNADAMSAPATISRRSARCARPANASMANSRFFLLSKRLIESSVRCGLRQSSAHLGLYWARTHSRRPAGAPLPKRRMSMPG